jgi:bifunctional non-homologous end joining protein LigD
VDEAPPGNGWLHEIKYDGYRMHARIDDGQVKLLTKTDLDWSERYHRTIEALSKVRVKSPMSTASSARSMPTACQFSAASRQP